MSDGPRNKLEIIRFSPSDYSLAGVLLKEHADLIEDLTGINAALSLFFQWPEHSNCLIQLCGRWTSCRLSYDEDERFPSEMRVQGFGTPSSELTSETSIVLRFEVFRTCYECEVNIVSRNEGDHLIVDIPRSLFVYRHRRAPRFEVSQESPSLIRQVGWLSEHEGPENICQFKVTEISFLSLLVECDFLPAEGGGYILIGREKFSATLFRKNDNKAVVLLNFMSGREAGRYFDFYKLIAFPHVLMREDLPYDETVRLYQEYLNQHFPKDRHEEIRSQLEVTWNDIKSGNHEVTADYVVVDSAKRVTGASSLALAFLIGERQQWAFHQLCTFKNPVNFDLTQDLYTWRLDYIASRPEPIDTVGWYVGRSRWVERIYTKFALLMGRGVLLQAVKVSEVFLGPSSSAAGEYLSYDVGNALRHVSSRGELTCGFGPKRFSVSGGLNIVYCHTRDGKISDFDALDKELASASNYIDQLYVSSTNDKAISSESWRAPVDRYFKIDGEHAISLRASIEHSLAVTKRKFLV